MNIFKKWWLKRLRFVFICSLFVIWFATHIPTIFYGTQDLPLHMSYVGDEQSPVNGALHILQDKNLLALKDLKTVYYGPIFSILAMPAIVIDFGEKAFFDGVRTAIDYKNFLLWDWGGVVWKLRLEAVLFGFFGLLGLYRLLYSASVNPSQRSLPVFAGTLLLALNFYYFEYASFWKHWALIIPILVWQIYFLIRFIESGFKSRYLFYSSGLFFISFGVSYLSVLFQVMWIPLIYDRYKKHDYVTLKKIFYYILSLFVSIAIIVAWHPRAFWRITGLVGSDVFNSNQSIYTAEKSSAGLSFIYYGLLIIKNHIALVLFAILGFFHLKRQFSLLKTTWFLPLFLVGATSFVTFGLISHHESRYSLPVIVSFIVITACMLPAYLDSKRSKVLDWIMGSLFVFTLLYHGTHIGAWTVAMAQGPKEQEIIKSVIAFERTHSNSKTLAIQYYLFGHVHTKIAYDVYTKAFNKADINLFKTIADAPLPQDIFPINAYYIRPDNKDAFSARTLSSYDLAVYKVEPRVDRNQFDYFDEDLTRLWWYKDLSPQYIFLK